MKFVTLTEQEYQLFIQKHAVHYTQSIAHYNYRQKYKKDVHLVGVKDNEEVIAACLLSEAQVLKIFKYFYSHRGPVLDFNNEKLVECFFTGLTRYLKRHKGLFVLVDPYILESNRDADGRILKSYDNSNLINKLNHLGYQYQGHSIGYSDTSQIRWLSVLDLEGKNEKDILNEMDYQTRRNIKKTYEMGVEVKTLDISQTDQFFELFRMAEEKHGFKFREKDYFEEMQNIYNNNSALKLAYIDLKKYLNQLNNKELVLNEQLEEIKTKLKDNPNSKKNKNKYQELNKQLKSNQKHITETKNLIKSDGDVLHLASAYYIWNKDEVYYLSSGSNPKYNQFMGAYRLQWDMINFALNNNIPRYNFYGITGNFSENAEDYGVQQFKKGFNAHVEEYIGDFIKPLRPIFYKVYKLRK